MKFKVYPNDLALPIDYPSSDSKLRKQAREQYVREQKGLCQHCGVDILENPKEIDSIDWSLFPTHFRKWPVHLHHCHKTGFTIGAIHMYCNAWLWQYKKE